MGLHIIKKAGVGWILVFFLLVGCGPSLKGMVVMPDGSKISEPNVVVYTNPWTDSVKVKNDGTFSIRKNVNDKNKYTLIAEDPDGNMGFVRGYQLSNENKDNVVIRLSREMDAKEAVIEGDLYIDQDSGPGEKILKSSQ
ncbi:hypothetical protein ACFL5V_02220 [Fibrobacterota bacterium]